MRFYLNNLLFLFFTAISFPNLTFGKEVPATPTGQTCRQFQLNMVFASGVATFQSQVQPVINSVQVKSVISAQFNCSNLFQVICYNTNSATSNFSTCMSQLGTIVANATTRPNSTPNQICAKFSSGTSLSQIGEMLGWYSDCP